MKGLKTEVAAVSVTFEQDNDCCDSETLGQEITVSTKNGGTEPEDTYLVIETKRWAIEPDGFEDFVDMLRRVYDMAVPVKEER